MGIFKDIKTAVGDLISSDYKSETKAGESRWVVSKFLIEHPSPSIYSVTFEVTEYIRKSDGSEVAGAQEIYPPIVMTPNVLSLEIPDIDFRVGKVIGKILLQQAFYQTMQHVGDLFYIVRECRKKGIILGVEENVEPPADDAPVEQA